MIPVMRYLRDHRGAGPLHTLMSVQSALDHYTFLTKRGALLTVLQARGRDPECLDANEQEILCRRFEAALRTFDEPYRIYQLQVKSELNQLPEREYAGRVGTLLRERRRYLEQKRPLYQIGTYLAVVYEAERHAPFAGSWKSKVNGAFRRQFSTEARSQAIAAQLEKASQTLAQKISAFAAQVEGIAHLRALPTSEAFKFLFSLVNYAPYKRDTAQLVDSRFVDFQLVQSALECHRDHLRVDDYFIRLLTLKELPPQTSAYQLRDLYAIPCQCIIATEWKREPSASMRRRIAAARRHYFNKKVSLLSYLGSSQGPSDRLVDDSAVALIRDLGASLEACDAKGQSFGTLALTFALYGQTREELQTATAELMKKAAALNVQIVDETYNALNAWLAIQPGNDAFNVRKHWLLETNYADWTLLGTPDQGSPINAHLQREHLAIFETDDGAPNYFNFHVGDVGHATVIGETGSGKSFLLNFLITHVFKYDPYVYVLDLGGSYKRLADFLGASYLRLGSGQDFTINPFSLEPTPANLQFLFSLVKVLIESSDFHLDAAGDADLFEQIKNLYAVEPAQRRLLTLSNILRRESRQRLQRWTQGGQYGWLFDNAEDRLTLERFQVFDFEGMDSYPQVLEPLLFYVLHRASHVVSDEALASVFKVFFIDEAWRFFHHPAIRLYVTEALKTWRRKNAAMVLATQSTEDLVRSGMLPVVSEACLTKLFLANRGMDPTVAREILRLNETESTLVERLTPKRELLIKRPDGSKRVTLSVDPKAYELYGGSGSNRSEPRHVVDHENRSRLSSRSL